MSEAGRREVDIFGGVWRVLFGSWREVFLVGLFYFEVGHKRDDLMR